MAWTIYCAMAKIKSCIMSHLIMLSAYKFIHTKAPRLIITYWQDLSMSTRCHSKVHISWVNRGTYFWAEGKSMQPVIEPRIPTSRVLRSTDLSHYRIESECSSIFRTPYLASLVPLMSVISHSFTRSIFSSSRWLTSTCWNSVAVCSCVLFSICSSFSMNFAWWDEKAPKADIKRLY